MPCPEKCQAKSEECAAAINEWSDAERIRVRYGNWFRHPGETVYEVTNTAQIAQQQCAMRQQSCLSVCAMSPQTAGAPAAMTP